MTSLTSPLSYRQSMPALLIAALSLPGSLPALEFSDAVPTLANGLQAQWRQTPLEAVLAQLAGSAGLPMTLSAGIKKRIAAHEVVTLHDAEACPLAALIEELEVVQELQISAASGVLLVETAEEADARPVRSAVCWQDDQPLIPADIATPDLFTPQGQKPGLSKDVPLDNSLLMSQVAGDLSADAMGAHPGDTISTANGCVVVQDHPHRIAVLRHRFTLLNRLRTAPQLVRVSYGLLKPEDVIPDGIIGGAEADDVLPKLQQVRTCVLEVSGPSRPASLAEETDVHTIVQSLNIVASSYEPQMETLTSGMSLQIQALPSLVGPLFEIRGLIQDDISVSQSHLEGGVTVTGNASFPMPMRHTVDLPTRWTWLPEARVAIPRHEALVMQTRLPSGHAVLLIQPGDRSDAIIPAHFEIGDKPATLAEELATIAMDCHAGLAVTRACQQQVNWTSAVSLPVHPDWSALALALSPWHIRLVLEGSRLLVDVAKENDEVAELLPVWTLAPLPESRMPDHLGFNLQQRRYHPPAFTVPPGMDTDGLLQKVGSSLDVSHVYQIENGLLLFRGQQGEAAHLLGRLAALEQEQVSGWWWRLYALSDDAQTAAPQDVLSAAAWAQLKDSQRNLVCSCASSGENVGEVYAGTQHRIIAEADIVQGLLEPIVTDVIAGSRLSVRAQQLPEGVHVTVELRLAWERAGGQSSVLTQGGKEAITMDLPRVSSSRASRQLTMPEGGAAILTSGGVRYALTCTHLRP